MLLISSAANLLLALANASSSRKNVFVFLVLGKRNFYQSDQSRGAEEINRPPCLLSLSPLQDVFIRSSRTLVLHFTSCMMGASRAQFLPLYLDTG